MKEPLSKFKSKYFLLHNAKSCNRVYQIESMYMLLLLNLLTTEIMLFRFRYFRIYIDWHHCDLDFHKECWWLCSRMSGCRNSVMFQLQFKRSLECSNTDEMWFNEVICLWMTYIYIYIYIYKHTHRHAHTHTHTHIYIYINKICGKMNKSKTYNGFSWYFVLIFKGEVHQTPWLQIVWWKMQK